ncbi:sulfatase-like hydrolase/transferase [Rubinisphaera margarita]|uniref:sulfatase-like hydrolase/transferase n=1 Tax=Rubinisphaera margarita TaxID=2909586 RepID=UPI001EE84E6B|nr:sulfatase-like hydrolase/transferase [Rubinisphaera margarita]MCG6155923.1 sulfatase-like hydrolase/transferase [Rubinisphaera margarita]
MLRVLIVLLLTTPTLVSAADRPSVLILYADDWGWGDLSCHGHPELKTPNLDQLAREGADFHQFMVNSPVCSPSRAALMTGHFPARYSVHQHFATYESNRERNMPDWLDVKAPSLPRMFQQAGYRTAHYGKWHLTGGGIADAPHPSEYGYDDSAVYVGPGRHVFEGTSAQKIVQEAAAHDDVAASFLTTAAVENALRFIRESKDEPFFVNVWLHETHHLVSATEEDKQAYPETPEPERTYYSAVTRADRQIGRLLSLLDEMGRTDNTIVIFSSDNGPEVSHEQPGQKFYYSVGSTGGLRGRKRSLYQGGVGTPFLIRWPGHVPAGLVDESTALTAVDFFPTLLAAAGIKPPQGYESDGENVLPALQGNEWGRTKPLFWEWQGNHTQDANWPAWGMRDGPWSLLIDETGERVELYHVLEDREQQDNRAASQKDRVEQMRSALDAWRSTLPKEPSLETISQNATKGPRATSKQKTPNRAGAFKRWDKNGDDLLTLEEYTNGLSKKDSAPTRFRNFDKDGNGELTREEFVGP